MSKEFAVTPSRVVVKQHRCAAVRGHQAGVGGVYVETDEDGLWELRLDEQTVWIGYCPFCGKRLEAA